MGKIADQIKGKCRHFKGRRLREGETCEIGHKYDDIAKVRELGFQGSGLRLPCTGDKPGSVTRGHAVQSCPDYDPLTLDEIEVQEKKWEEHMNLILSGVSACCKAPIDESHVIQSGPHKGHGGQYCSKCGKVVFWV